MLARLRILGLDVVAFFGAVSALVPLALRPRAEREGAASAPPAAEPSRRASPR